MHKITERFRACHQKQTLRGAGACLLAILFLLALAPYAQAQSCIDDKTGVTNNCTAADVTLGLIFVPLEPEEPIPTCTPGGDVDVKLVANIVAGSQARYDIGMFIALDGGDARTGECLHDFIRPVDGKGCTGIDLGFIDDDLAQIVTGTCFRDLEPGDALDICGDVQQGEDNVYALNEGNPVTIPCTPNPENPEQVIVRHCTSWDNNTNSTCEGLDDAVPGTRAKCNCGFSVVGNLEIEAEPNVLIEKTNDEGGSVPIGATANFTIEVTNTSGDGTPLTNLVVTDDRCDDPPEFDSCTDGSPASLPDGGSCTYACSVANVTSSFVNTATVTTDEDVTSQASSSVEITGGEIIIAKQTDPQGSSQLFEFLIVGPGFDNDEGDDGEIVLADGNDFNTGLIAPGEYTVSETNMPPGWSLDEIDCGDKGQETDESSLTFQLNDEDIVTCTFSNTIERGTIIVEKVADPSDTTQTFNFTSNFTEDFTLGAGDDEVTSGLLPSSEAGSYNVSETVPDGWTLVSAECTGDNTPDEIDLQPGEEVTCTFINEQDDEPEPSEPSPAVPIPLMSPVGLAAMFLLMLAVGGWVLSRRATRRHQR